MIRLLKDPTWVTLTALAAFIAVLTIVVPTLNPDVTHIVALRNGVFWAGVTAPVAYLMDLVVRTSFDYARRLSAHLNQQR